MGVGNSKGNYCDFINFVSYLERKLSKFPPASSSMYVQTLVSLSEDIAREREMEPEEENVVAIKVEQKESTKKKKKKKKKILVVEGDNNNSKEAIVDENIENVKPSSSEVSISSTNSVIPAPPSTIKNIKPLSILNVKLYNNQKKIDDNEKSKSATTKSKRQQNMDVIRSLSAISEQAMEEIVETGKENIISNNNKKDDGQESSTAINNDTENTSEFDDNIPSSLQASLLNSPSAPSSPKPKTTTSLQKDEKHIISSSSDSSTTRR